MSMRAVNQNNVLAGSFVIGGVFLAVAISFILGDLAGKFGEKKSYVVRFPTDVGVMGLEAGAEVTFAGLTVGSVVSVGMHYKEDSALGVRVPDAMDVEIALDPGLVLFEDAIADLSPPILGGISRINIASAGTGAVAADGDRVVYATDAGGVLDEGEILMGRFAPSILTQMGLGAEEAKKIKDVITKFPEWTAKVDETAENVKETSASVRRMTEKLEPDFYEGVDDGTTTMANVREFSEKLNGDDGWGEKIDVVVGNVKDVSEQIGPVIEDAKGALASVRGTVDENRDKVGRILDNVEQSTERIRFETIDRANELLADGALALGSAKETLGEVQGLVAENRTTISATLVNARQLSLQGKLFLEEIRSQPWRLLNKPSKKDLRREPMYEAARTYAGAVADLRFASESLDTAVRMSGGGEVSGDEFAVELLRLASVVEQAYGRYEIAERGLLGLLAESP
ncbi:MAG: MCE family protein [Phycisphaerales bacterium]|nr:MCE family protein [Phycisphaerales bacterium]